MADHGKRIPGQSNADWERPASDPNADSQGTHSLYGGGDRTGIFHMVKSFLDWVTRRWKR